MYFVSGDGVNWTTVRQDERLQRRFLQRNAAKDDLIKTAHDGQKKSGQTDGIEVQTKRGNNQNFPVGSFRGVMFQCALLAYEGHSLY